MSRGRQSKFWVFTLNNPESDEVPKEFLDTQYCVWQREEVGTPHLQGYVIFNTQKRLAWIKSHCHPMAHWEPRAGTHDQAKQYCTKEDSRKAGPWETGEEPVAEQGKRNDLLSLKRRMDEGATEAAICKSDDTFAVWAKYGKCISRYKALSGQQRTWPTTTVVYYGPPGTGKSSRALAEGGPDAFWLSKPAGQTAWWDGYYGQEVVVIDEFYGWIARDLMCRLCDRYPTQVETKGGSQPFLAKKIIITSNEHPRTWWSKIGLGPMERRLTGALGTVIYMAEPAHGPFPPIIDPALLPQGWGPAPAVQVMPTIVEEEELQAAVTDYITVQQEEEEEGQRHFRNIHLIDWLQ